MKKIFLTVCTVILLTAVTAAPMLPAKQRKIDITNLPVKNVSGFFAEIPENLQTLDNWSTYIVKGVLSDDAVNYEPVYNDPEYGDLTGFTASTLTILESYKGDLKPGDTIPLGEGYCVRYGKDNEPYLLTYFGNRPLIPGREYILFLCPPDDSMGKDRPWSDLYSQTFPVLSNYEVPLSNEKVRSVDEREIVEFEELYHRIEKQVAEKYFK